MHVTTLRELAVRAAGGRVYVICGRLVGLADVALSMDEVTCEECYELALLTRLASRRSGRTYHVPSQALPPM